VLKWAHRATLDSDDLKTIKNLLEVTIEEAIEEKIATKNIFGQLLTKNDFYKKWMSLWES
jgi:hypothetical protein